MPAPHGTVERGASAPARSREDPIARTRPERRLATPAGSAASVEPSANNGDGWADRGWYLAIEYGVLARDRFLKRLPLLRRLGRFKELLEPGGRILYRNLFRREEVRDAWELLTALRPWHDRLVCYLNGEEQPLKEVQDVLWCASFLRKDNPCRGSGESKGERLLGCPGARIVVSAGNWELVEDDRRHLLTFTRVDPDGVLRPDHDAIAAYVSRPHARSTRCPISPARDPARFAAAFAEVGVTELDWPLVAELSPDVARRIGAKALEQEHGFSLEKGEQELEDHAALELASVDGEVQVRRAGQQGAFGRDLRIPIAVRRVLDEGVLLRAVRIDEGYVRRKGGHYDLEQRFVLSARVRFLPTDEPERFQGYVLTTHPRATPEYAAWVDRIAAGLRPVELELGADAEPDADADADADRNAGADFDAEPDAEPDDDAAEEGA